MASALLVCGSRSLTRDPAGLAWVTDTLRAVLSPRPDLLVHGGARGPDEMADAEAARVQVPDILTFYPNGTLRQRRVGSLPVHATYAEYHWADADSDPGPLLRNRAMVNYLLTLADVGRAVRVVGLVDATSATRGTDHTLRLARAAGLTVERLVWEGGRADPSPG